MPEIGDVVTIAIAGEVMGIRRGYADVRIGHYIYRFPTDSLTVIEEDAPPTLQICVEDGVGTEEALGG